MYMDTDVIVIRPLDQLDNVIGFERPDGPASGVLKFAKGNAFLGDCINEYFATYKSNTHSWGYVGPNLLKRIYQGKYPECQLPDAPPNNDPKQGKVDPACPVVILWKDAFYPNVDNCFVVTPNVSEARFLFVVGISHPMSDACAHWWHSFLHCRRRAKSGTLQKTVLLPTRTINEPSRLLKR
jgi:hypothetical protein